WHSTPCKLDPGRADVDPGRRAEMADVERPAKEAAGPATCVEESLIAGQSRAEQRTRDLAHPAVPPVVVLDREDLVVVIGGDAGRERAFSHCVEFRSNDPR